MTHSKLRRPDHHQTRISLPSQPSWATIVAGLTSTSSNAAEEIFTAAQVQTLLAQHKKQVEQEQQQQIALQVKQLLVEQKSEELEQRDEEINSQAQQINFLSHNAANENIIKSRLYRIIYILHPSKSNHHCENSAALSPLSPLVKVSTGTGHVSPFTLKSTAETPNPPYCLELASKQTRKNAMSIIISAARWNIPMQASREKVVLKCKEPFPESLEECQAEYKQLHKDIQKIGAQAVSFWRSKQGAQLQARLAEGEKAGAIALRNMIVAQETKET
ncbi:hypothetical protein IV203_013015 [Nitzschia inconspicua]|uniref:Uncharacterized protein n=1 Tax=Nitzschia inconspicua TaxID=303405 RepID=A0A9K3M669_9STRA|nr:hypothetical protein IV203_013015 [Nitzschia inconspicua]